jgi:hypothetical protein
LLADGGLRGPKTRRRQIHEFLPKNERSFYRSPLLFSAQSWLPWRRKRFSVFQTGHKNSFSSFQHPSFYRFNAERNFPILPYLCPSTFLAGGPTGTVCIFSGKRHPASTACISARNSPEIRVRQTGDLSMRREGPAEKRATQILRPDKITESILSSGTALPEKAPGLLQGGNHSSAEQVK